MLGKGYQQAFVVMVLLGAMHGCESGNSDVGRRESEVPPSIDKPLSAIPGGAQIVATSATGLTFRAPVDGMVYLYDVADQKTINANRIARGSTYEVLLDRSMVRIGERVEPVTQLLPLVDGREYRIYFSPAPRDPEAAR